MIEIKDSVFEPEVVRRRKEDVVEFLSGNTYFYKVFIYTQGKTMPYVDSITYFLHSSIENNVRTIKRKPSNEYCKIEIETPGIFKVKATISYKDGKVENVEHYLNFPKELKEFGIIK